jgi:thiamine kinase
VAAPLPHDGELRLAQVLAQWRHWDCDPPLAAPPAPAGALAPGQSNRSYRVDARDGRAFVVRLDGVDPLRHGISRQAEWHALQLAHARGLAPRPCYRNPELGALVCDYLHPTPCPAESPLAVGELLRAIHALPPLHCRLDLAARIARYRHQAGQQAPQLLAMLAPFTAAVDRLVAWLGQCGEAPVLCHNDLLAGNRLYSAGRLWALDWEYCAMGNRWFELAVVCCGDDWAPKATAALVTAYLRRPARAHERQQLAACSLVYRYLELLWYACVHRGHGHWDRKLTALHAQLSALTGPPARP